MSGRKKYHATNSLDKNHRAAFTISQHACCYQSIIMDMSDAPDPNVEKLASDGQRHATRESLFLLGRLFLPDEEPLDVRVRNLSATGMMVESPVLGKIGDAVHIELKGIGKRPARIAWIAEKRMGIALVDIIDPQQARPTPKVSADPATYLSPTIAMASQLRRPGLKII